jgi:hypothetical protein
VVLRIAFGAVLFISTIRFMVKGWVYDFYIAPGFHFPFLGFEWVRPLSAAGMYTVFAGMLLSSLLILLGLFYRGAVAVFLLLFTYVELLDKSYYLNHYYFVSLFTFLLLLVPANRSFSLDVWRKPSLRLTQVPAWTIRMLQAQLLLVYFFAGLSKLTPDWLLRAMPLRIWLPANTGLPVIGPLLGQVWVAYVFSWFGAVFDLSIGFLLLYRPTRKIAYVFVLLFHVLTACLFKIGMFPWIMIAATMIFFSWGHASSSSASSSSPSPSSPSPSSPSPSAPSAAASSVDVPSPQPVGHKPLLIALLAVYFGLQVLVPLRYLLYPGHLFWTEEGYRFSWRVMLMEKGGTAFFYVKDPATNRRGEVITGKYLTPLQERMMVTQPDMILQYAHHLKDIYRKQGIADPVVTVESYVTLNGSGSRLYIDSTVDLAKQPENLYHKTWILPFQ